MTDTLPRDTLPTRQRHIPSRAQVDGKECMSCDVPFSGDADDRVPLENGRGYRCADAPACAQQRALKYGKQAANKLRPIAQNECGPEDGHDVG